MYIEVVKNKGVEYIRLVQSRRIKNLDGKSLPSKKVICTLGKLSKYDDKKPDYTTLYFNLYILMHQGIQN